MKLSKEAREKVEKAKAIKAMNRARSKTVPVSPKTLDEVIAQLESPLCPPEYREMYLGNVQRKIRGQCPF